MTPDRTDAVLAAIDGALDDWSVSGDAMRWTPEVEVADDRSHEDRAQRAYALLTDIVSTRDADGEWTVLGVFPDSVAAMLAPYRRLDVDWSVISNPHP